jgi:hypothetical protein
MNVCKHAYISIGRELRGDSNWFREQERCCERSAFGSWYRYRCTRSYSTLLDAPNVGNRYNFHTSRMWSQYTVHAAVSVDFSHTVSGSIPSLSHRQDLGEVGAGLDNVHTQLEPQTEPWTVQPEGAMIDADS